MSNTKEKFNADVELNEIFMFAVKKITGVIPVIKEAVSRDKKLKDLENRNKELKKQLDSLKISFELVQGDAKERIKEIISIKEEELENIKKEIKEIKSLVIETSNELMEYEKYIDYIYNRVEWRKCKIDIKTITIEEFIGYLCLYTNFGQDSHFPEYSYSNYPKKFNDIISVIRKNDWTSFFMWIANSN